MRLKGLLEISGNKRRINVEVLRKFCAFFVKPLSFIIAKIIYRVKVEGMENVPKNEACIICGNHVHALDAPALVAVTTRKIRFMAKEELWKSAGLRFMAFVYRVFPVKRGQRDTDAIRTSLKILKNKEILGIYPEGTRNGLAKGVKPKNGAVNIAIRAGVPIVPFAVIGTFKPFTKVIYRFDKPIDYSEYKEKGKDKDVVDGLTKELMDKIVELRDKKVNS